MTQARVAMAVMALMVAASLALLVTDKARGTAGRVVVPTTAGVAPDGDPSSTLPMPAAAATAAPRPPSSTGPKDPGPAQKAPAPPTATVEPGAVTPPPTGTYRYRYAGDDGPLDGTLTVTAGPGVSRQTHRLAAGVDGSAQQSVIDWSSTARTTISAGTGRAPVCAWTPGLLSLRLPLTTGATWKADSTCGATTKAGATSVHRTEEATVQGATRTQVAGRPVEVWVIARHTLTEIVGAATARAFVEAQTSELFAPSLGLVVYQVTRTATPRADQSTATTTQTTELLDQRSS